MYDFSKGKEYIDERVRGLCRDAVGSVRWESVYGAEEDEGWDNGRADWDMWDESYGKTVSSCHMHQSYSS